MPHLSALEDMAIRYYLRRTKDFDDYEAKYKEIAADTERMKEIIVDYKKYADIKE